MSDLKRTDIALLEAAKKSNGGGVQAARTPVATQRRMLDAGLLKRKPGESWMLIITKAGREALEAARR